MRCVVCGKLCKTGSELYPNAWEATRKRYPCCSRECAERFNLDEHWFPVVCPEEASHDDQIRLLRVARDRLRDGDDPRIVVREMLQAGVWSSGVRKLCHEEFIISEDEDRRAEVGAGRAAGGLFPGSGLINKLAYKMFGSDEQRRTDIKDVLKDIDQWEERYSSDDQ